MDLLEPTHKILHFDMDCFYAQVEMRDNPSLRNIPIGIGGPPKSRSVLCTSNYEARKFGVKAAMPVDFALKLCPKLKIVYPNFKKYQEVSEEIFDIYHQYSDHVETLSLDEAYIKIDSSENASLLAKEIKSKILKKTNLTSSAGVSYNKFLSKIASDWKKPDGFFVIRPSDSYHFLTPLPVSKLPGVGPKTNDLLKSLKIITVGDLREIDQIILHEALGDFAFTLKEFSMGIDHREVVPYSIPKSISVEETYLEDLSKIEIIQSELLNLYPRLNKRLNSNEEQFFYKIIIKLKTHDFKRYSMEKVIPQKIFEEFNDKKQIDQNISQMANDLLVDLYERVNRPIRLIGLGFKLVDNNPYSQLLLPF